VSRSMVSIAFRHSPRSRLEERLYERLRRLVTSPLPFGIHRVPDADVSKVTADSLDEVSIAFRHSPRSRPGGGADGGSQGWASPLPFGIHRVPDQASRAYTNSDVVASPLPFGIHRVPDWPTAKKPQKLKDCLHCLSAFTAFPTIKVMADKKETPPRSPLPFGIHRVPDSKLLHRTFSLTFGLHCLSAFTAFPTP